MNQPDNPSNPPPDESSLAAPIDTRTNRINISGDTVTKATADLPEEERRLIRWAFDYAKANDFDWKEAQRFFKISSTVLYRIWKDDYRQPDYTFIGKGPAKQKIANPKAGERIGLGGVCAELDKAHRLAEARKAVSKLPFIETSVWKRVEHVAKEVLISQSVGFIYGESQIGKTACIREYQRRNNHGQTVLVTMPPAAGVQLMCKEIARALHIGESAFDKTYRRICDALDGEKLLIIDEAHMIFETYQTGSVKRCLATLRHIHDASQCGLLICATDVFATEAKTSQFRNTMKQFFRRGTLTLQLGTVAPWEDVVAIAAHYRLHLPDDGELAKHQDREEVRRIQLITAEDGLGKLTKYLAGAARMAAKKSDRLNWSHFLRYCDITDRMAQPVVSKGGRK